jgi:CTP:molybdopterin cytidylyltransferase MocA
VTIGALVLAAGEGRRFGGTKQLAELDGRPLLSYALAAVAAISPRVVVLGHAAEEIVAAVDLHGARPVICPDFADGQAASLKCGVAALGDVSAAVVTLGDQPFITPDVIAAVIDRLEGHDAVRATYDGRPGHPVVLARPLLDRVHELHGDAGFRDLLSGPRVRRFEAGHLCDPADIDTREELARR